MEKPDRGVLSSSFNVVARRSPFRETRIRRPYDVGTTLLEVLEDVGIESGEFERTAITVNAKGVLPEQWAEFKPEAGAVVTVRSKPGVTGTIAVLGWLTTALSAAVPGAGALGATITGAVGTTGVLANAVVGAAFSFAATLVSAVGISYVTSLVMNALVSPPEQDDASGGQGTQSPTISGTGNNVRPGAPVPMLFGKHRMNAIPYGAQPFTETLGGVQYIRGLLVVGLGPIRISDIRVGDVPIDEVDGDVQYETREGWLTDTPVTLYQNSIFQTSVGVSFETAFRGEDKITEWVQKQTHADIESIGVEISLPQGIFRANENGAPRNFKFSIELEYRTADIGAGAGPWLPAPDVADFGPLDEIAVAQNRASVTLPGGSSINFKGATRNPFLLGWSWTVPNGLWDVRMRRVEINDDRGLPGGSETSAVSATLVWSTLKSITFVDPINLPGLALIAFRFEANESVRGSVSKVTCLGEKYLPTWDPSTGVSAPVITRNPAWAYLEVLRGTSNPRPVPDSRVGFQEIKDWADFCDEQGYTLDRVIDNQTTVYETARSIASSARATLDVFDGTYTVLVDKARSAPTQVFTPVNSTEYRWSKAFPDVPHALRCRFVNSEKEYQVDERIVYADGFDESSAINFESMTLYGAMTPERAWKEGRFMLSIGRLRPELHTWSAQLDQLVCRRGDWVQRVDDASLIGLGYGRVVSAAGFGFSPDSLWEILLTTEYGVTIRYADGTIKDYAVNSLGTGTARAIPNFENTIILTETPSPAITNGDVYTLGLLGEESEDLIISRIIQHPDLTATIEAQNYSPELFELDGDEVPPFESLISQPAPTTFLRPATPEIDGIFSDERALVALDSGGLVPTIVVVIRLGQGQLPTSQIEVQFRTSNPAGNWLAIPLLPPTTQSTRITEVQQGQEYDVRVRAISQSELAPGSISSWRYVYGHLVIGLSELPPDVEELRLEGGNTLVWNYPLVPIDFDGFEVRFQLGEVRAWDTATKAHDGLIPGSTFVLPQVGPGTQTWLVKARDVAGNYSENANILVKNLGDPLFDNIVLTTDEKVAGFLGTKTLCTVDGGGDLVADALPDTFWAADTVPFWNVSDAALFWATIYETMTYVIPFTVGVTPPRGTVVLDLVYEGESILVEYAPDALFWDASGASLFWDADDTSLFWDDAARELKPFPGSVVADTGTYLFRFTIPGGKIQGKITTLIFNLDVPDVIETVEDLVTAAGGTTISSALAKTFEKIVAVSYTVQTDGNGGVTVRVKSKTDTEQTIEVLNAAGTAVIGLVDLIAEGY